MDAFVDEFGRSHDGEVRFKVADGSPVSHDIRISSRVFAVKQLNSSATGTGKGGGIYVLESTIKMSSEDEIGNSQSFANKVGMILQVSIKVLHDPFHEMFGQIDILFVVAGIATESGTEPCTECREDFMVCKGQPLDCLSVGFDVLGDESRVWVLLSNYTPKSATRTSNQRKASAVERISRVISA